MTKLVSEKAAVFSSLSPGEKRLCLCVSTFFFPYPVTGLALLITVIYGLLQKETRSKMLRQKGTCFLLFFSVLIVTVPIFYQRWFSVLAGIGAGAVLLFWLYSLSVVTRNGYLLSLDFICAASFIAFFIAVLQKLILGFSFRSTAGLLNANYYGMMLEFSILIALFKILTQKKHFVFYGCVILSGVAGIFLCDCQSAWLAVIAGALLLLFMNGYQKIGYLFIGASFLLVLALVFVPGVLPRMVRLPQTFATRMNIWETALKGFLDHPLLGQGVLSYYYIHDLYGGYKTYHAHSIYLDPLLSFGLAGVSLLISYITAYCRNLCRRVKKQENKMLLTLVLAAVAAVMIHGFTDTAVLWIQTGGLWLYLLSGSSLVFQKKKLDKIVCI